MNPEEFSSRMRGIAREKVEWRPGVTYEGRALWPLEILGTAVLGAAVVGAVILVLLKVVLG